MSRGWSGGSCTVVNNNLGNCTNSSQEKSNNAVISTNSFFSSSNSTGKIEKYLQLNVLTNQFLVTQTNSLTMPNQNQSFKINGNTSVDWNGLVDNVFEEEISSFVQDFHRARKK